MVSFRQLIVFNQYTDLSQISEVIRLRGAREVVLLTSHALFPSEKRELSEYKVTFRNFTELTDAELAHQADRTAYNEVERTILMYSVYVRFFKERSVYHKNRLIYERLGQKFDFIDVFCGPIERNNLNISNSYWRKAKACIHRPSRQKSPSGFRVLFKKITAIPVVSIIGHRAMAWVASRKKQTFYVIDAPGRKWFFRTLHRIKLHEGVSAGLKRISPIKVPGDAVLAVPLHRSGELLNLHPYVERRKVVIVQDAFRPSVYPPYLFANSFRDCGFIPRDAFDRLLFSKVKGVYEVQKPPFIQFTRPFNPPEPHHLRIQNVVLSLNHAGDWTAEISRSDTDLLIMAFMELAEQWPDLKMIIRLHPTMNSLEGEGAGASDRIKKVVGDAKISNLEVSSVSLDEDWERGDLFISEYSLSAIDALGIGKPVLFVNLTNRQSYMADYANLGFLVSDSTAAFRKDIRSIMENPTSYYKDQLSIYRNYLHNFSRFEEEITK